MFAANDVTLYFNKLVIFPATLYSLVGCLFVFLLRLSNMKQKSYKNVGYKKVSYKKVTTFCVGI